MSHSSSFTLVLSGGGLKGLAHIGVFQALEERGLVPSVVVGCSMGSLVASAWAAGRSVEWMKTKALGVRRRHVFQVAHADMAFRRMLAPAIYRREPLETLIDSLVGDQTFYDLEHRLLVNTVDINSGMQVLWGLPGLQGARVADAVFASCSLPGIFPPQEIEGRFYVDGAVVDNLPVRAGRSAGTGPIMAVEVGSSTVLRSDVEKSGFAATYIRGLEIVMQTMLEGLLRGWSGPPILLVHPRVEHVSMFSFDHTRELIQEGYRATIEAIDQNADVLGGTVGGIHPRRKVQIQVNEERCIGCGECVMRAPHVFRLNGEGKAEVVEPIQSWSPLDGGYIRNCPTYAITARLAQPR